MQQPTAALRPLTLPSLPPDLSRLSELKAQLAQLHSDVERYQALERKLDGFTDQPTWNAYIPFGPLAYFPGQLVHTNDITQTLPSAPSSAETSQASSGGRADAGSQEGDGGKVLRSAKQAREEAQRLRTELDSKIVGLEQEIAAKEAELKKKREAERKLGKAGSEGAMAGMGDDDDWTINERGEVINEEGLPMFDIREELPLSPEPSASAASASRGPDDGSRPKPKQMRYLIKKGGKQVVPPTLKGSASTPTGPLATPSPSSAASSPAPGPRPSPAPISSPVPSPIAEPGPKLDIKSILDELEAEEKAEREAREAREMEEREKEVAMEPDGAPEGRIFEMAVDEKAAPPVPATAPAPAKSPSPQPFAGFSAGFLSKSKQKRPSNSLVSPPPPSAPSPAPAAPPAPTPAPAPAPALKSSLSRPASPSRANSNNTAKRVAFDLPVPDSEVPTREGKSKAAPIILGMGPLSSSEAEEAKTRPAPEKQEEGKKEPFVRPIKEMVVERPMKKVVPPGGGKGDEGKKRVSRFRKARDAEEGDAVMEKAGAVEEEKEEPMVENGKGKERAPEPSLPQQQQQPKHDIPAPIHTISLSSKPSAPSSSTSTARADGTISYADIDFDSSEEDPDSMDVDSDDFAYSDEDDFDDEDFDVDAALHQREVALAYHRQRLGVGAGYGTGALGGYHAREASPFGATEQGLVPADATLDSLSSPLTHASALGKPSRFRTANKHLESASLIIPSLVAADPTLTTSHSPLGPAPDDDDDERRGEDDLDEKEQERLRRTLEALAEGRPLPEDEQVLEREKEVRLREELMKDKMEEQRRREMALQRSAGKAPPSVVQVPREREREKEPVVIAVPGNEPRGEVSTKEQEEEERREEERREEMRRELEKMTVETAGEGEGGKPKRMSRFRQKQLGLVD
ncbi:hypothetical protein JCM1840_001201 [Sporobolomyces johnsonii]